MIFSQERPRQLFWVKRSALTALASGAARFRKWWFINSLNCYENNHRMITFSCRSESFASLSNWIWSARSWIEKSQYSCCLTLIKSIEKDKWGVNHSWGFRERRSTRSSFSITRVTANEAELSRTVIGLSANWFDSLLCLQNVDDRNDFASQEIHF